jgi:hypothetical protein
MVLLATGTTVQLLVALQLQQGWYHFFTQAQNNWELNLSSPDQDLGVLTTVKTHPWLTKTKLA